MWTDNTSSAQKRLTLAKIGINLKPTRNMDLECGGKFGYELNKLRYHKKCLHNLRHFQVFPSLVCENGVK